MVSVKIAETFDLCTERGALGLIGIHTPPRALLERHYGGLMNNHKAIRFTGCDVYFACAAQLPVDPNGIGFAGGQVNPSDMMNPVLYRAVSNEYFETIIARIYGGQEVHSSTDGGSLTLASEMTPLDNPPVGMDDFNIYYGILSNADGWRKAMPQTGFEMHGLRPLMWSVLQNYGNSTVTTASDSRAHAVIGSGYRGGGDSDSTSSTSGVATQRGIAHMAPPVPLWRGLGGTPRGPLATTFPLTYVGAIIVPPCHATGSRLYYRLRIVWHVEFLGLTSHQTMSSFLEMNNNGLVFYYNDYASPSKMETTDMVDVNGLEIDKVMEGGN